MKCIISGVWIGVRDVQARDGSSWRVAQVANDGSVVELYCDDVNGLEKLPVGSDVQVEAEVWASVSRSGAGRLRGRILRVGKVAG